jgi:hypothetical protein
MTTSLVRSEDRGWWRRPPFKACLAGRSGDAAGPHDTCRRDPVPASAVTAIDGVYAIGAASRRGLRACTRIDVGSALYGRIRCCGRRFVAAGYGAPDGRWRRRRSSVTISTSSLQAGPTDANGRATVRFTLSDDLITRPRAAAISRIRRQHPSH